VSSVEDRGADADEDVVLDGAAVDGGVVADADAVADEDRVEVAHAVEDGAVLDVGAGADADAVGVATDYGVHPERGLGAEMDVADELGGGVDVAAGGDGGGDAAVRADHGIKYIGPTRTARVGLSDWVLRARRTIRSLEVYKGLRGRDLDRWRVLRSGWFASCSDRGFPPYIHGR
jgi:hypothetical protein